MVDPQIDDSRVAKFYAYHGGLAGALAANRTSLERHFGHNSIIARFIPALKGTIVAALLEDAARMPMAHYAEISAYLRAKLAHQALELVLLLLLDAAGRLIADIVLVHGGLDQASVHPRAVMVHALELGAASVILAHNHPSGNPAPSKADIAITRDIVQAGLKLGVRVHDHLIVGREGIFSMRAQGIL